MIEYNALIISEATLFIDWSSCECFYSCVYSYNSRIYYISRKKNDIVRRITMATAILLLVYFQGFAGSKEKMRNTRQNIIKIIIIVLINQYTPTRSEEMFSLFTPYNS